jgi:hypothetical protein
MSSILKTVINGLMNGQSSTVLNNYTPAQLLRETEQLLGLDDLLVNGKNYRPERIGVNGNPNFEWDERNGARLFIKGQCFVHVNLSYDIVSDQLVLNQPLNQDIVRQVLLKPEFIDSFYLGDQLFINPGKIMANAVAPGYFEQVTPGKVLFLKKYKKTFIKIFDSSNKGQYSPQKNFYYLMNEGKLISVNTKGAFLSFYKAHKKNIREFMRSNDIAYRKAGNQELKNLMTY